MPLVFKHDFGHMSATAGSNEYAIGKSNFRPLYRATGALYISNKPANVDFQEVQRMGFIGVD